MIPANPMHDRVSLLDELQRHDAVGAVVRAHFEIDRALQRAVESLTLRPKELPQLRYEQKARLAVALGLEASVLPAVLMLGQLREGAALSQDAGVTDSTVNQLFGLLARQDREAVLRLHAQRGSGSAYQQATALQRFIIIIAIIDASLATSVAATRASLGSDADDVEPDPANQPEVVSFEWSPPPAANTAQRPRDLSTEALYSYLTAGDWSYWS